MNLLNRFIRIVDSPINIVKFSKTYPSTHFIFCFVFELRCFETLLSGLLITYGDTASSQGVSRSLLDELIVHNEGGTAYFINHVYDQPIQQTSRNTLTGCSITIRDQEARQ